MELRGTNIKKVQEMETPKKIPYVSGNENPKKVSYISGNRTFQSTLRKFLILQETEAAKNKLFGVKTKFYTTEFSQKIH